MKSILRLGCAVVAMFAVTACEKLEKRPVVLHFADGTNVTCLYARFIYTPMMIECHTRGGDKLSIAWDDHVMGYEVSP